MLKKLFLYSWFLVSWVSCAQNTKKDTKMTQEFNLDTYVDSITIHN
ncbi:hypothetical protein [Cellulophaga fucicola]